jgi:hypothetical protein
MKRKRLLRYIEKQHKQFPHDALVFHQFIIDDYDFSGIDLFNVRFINCVITNCCFDNAKMDTCRFVNTDICRSSFKNVDLSDMIMTTTGKRPSGMLNLDEVIKGHEVTTSPHKTDSSKSPRRVHISPITRSSSGDVTKSKTVEKPALLRSPTLFLPMKNEEEPWMPGPVSKEQIAAVIDDLKKYDNMPPLSQQAKQK